MKNIESVTELLELIEEGKIDKDSFELWIDNDSIDSNINPINETIDSNGYWDCEDYEYNFSMNPYDLMLECIDLLGLKSEHV